MKKLIRNTKVLVFLLLIGVSYFSSAQNFYEDSQVYTVGTLPHSCTHIPYPDSKSAIEGTFEASSFYMSLKGFWAFNWVEKVSDCPKDFFKPEYDVSSWKEIPVPSCWEREGYGYPFHGSATNQFRAQKLKIPNVPDENPVGS